VRVTVPPSPGAAPKLKFVHVTTPSLAERGAQAQVRVKVRARHHAARVPIPVPRNRDLNVFEAACQAADYIMALPLGITLAAAASPRAGQWAVGAAERVLSGKGA
jgi:hypothetical protein